MRKLFFILSFILLFSLVSAQEQNFNETKQLIDSGISCDKFTDEQLEEIGEYYMEQMHPGEAHELMHKMMGLEESSDAEKQFHTNIAKRLYCNEDIYGGYGMMGGNMMENYGGMMNMMYGTSGSGMMGNYRYNFGYWNFFNIFYIILLVGLTILIILLIIKLWKSIENKKGRR